MLRAASLAASEMSRGRPDHAARRYAEAVAEARALDEPELVARLLSAQARALERAGACALALPPAREASAAVEGAAGVGSDLVIASCSRSTEEIRAAHDRARRRAAGDACLLASVDRSEGAERVGDDDDGAAALYRAADARGCEAPEVTALCAFNAGRLAARRAQPELAAERFAQAASSSARVGDAAALAEALAAAADARAATGDLDEAARLAERAGHAAAGAGRHRLAASAFADAAERYQTRGELERAAACRARGRAALERLPSKR